jgi:simple sugar transport system permease protein
MTARVPLLGKLSETLILILVMVAVFLLMWALNGSLFFQPRNFQSMAFQLPELGLLALAMMITMLTGGINLAIIASANLSGIVMALILTQFITPETSGAVSGLIVALAISAGLLAGLATGLLNGLLIAVIEVSPILATLGTMTLITGVNIVLTKGYVLSGLPDAVRFVGNGAILGIPVPLLIFLLCAALVALMLRRTPQGINMYMIGSNPTATHYAGVDNRKVLMKTYLLSGLLCGVAALVMISRFNSAKADYGESYLLMTILAAVLGGTDAYGGFGKVSGLVIALIILQLVSSGLNLLGISAFLTLAVWGLIIILVMGVNTLSSRHRIARRSAPQPAGQEGERLS